MTGQNIPQEIAEAFQAWSRQAGKYPAWAGSYDKSHSDKCRETRLWNRLVALIEDAGLNVLNTLAKLS